MARTKGSGWGGGVMLYQLCPLCKKKKVIFDPIPGQSWYKPFRCLACKETFNSDILLRLRYKEQETKQTDD